MPKHLRSESGQSEEKSDIEAMMEVMLEDLCTTSQAAEILGVTQDHVLNLIYSKKIPAVQLDNTWIVHKPSLQDYLKNKSRRGKPPSGKPKLER